MSSQDDVEEKMKVFIFQNVLTEVFDVLTSCSAYTNLCLDSSDKFQWILGDRNFS